MAVSCPLGPRSAGLPSGGVKPSLPERLRPGAVTLADSGEVLPWKPGTATILQLLHDAGIPHPAGCQEGDCGACTTPLLDGRVVYLTSPNAMFDEETCLPCCCRPVGAVVLGA